MNRILIVEDEDEIRTGLRYFFEASGCYSEEACNGREALILIEKNLPDIIISDIMMPCMNGYELIKAVKNNDAAKTIPFLFLSAKTDKEEIKMGYELGADGYITKPFSVKELLDIVGIHLARGIAG